MARHGLTDGQWALMEDMFPRNGEHAGRPWQDHRRMMNGIFWILSTGAPWRDLPEEFGRWQTVYHRFNTYRRDGTLDRILERLQVKLDREGKIDWELFCIDGSCVRAARAAAGARKRGVRQKSPRTMHWGVLAGAGAPSSI